MQSLKCSLNWCRKFTLVKFANWIAFFSKQRVCGLGKGIFSISCLKTFAQGFFSNMVFHFGNYVWISWSKWKQFLTCKEISFESIFRILNLKTLWRKGRKKMLHFREMKIKNEEENKGKKKICIWEKWKWIQQEKKKGKYIYKKWTLKKKNGK